MKRFSEQLHKKSQTVKLSKSEQADLRERLVSYMEYHPLPADMKEAYVPDTKVKQTTLTDSFAYYAIPFHSFFKFGSIAAVFVLLVVPFMAERSVPGDSLYSVKVQFNEELRSTLTWGSYEKVEWETERLNRRIAEARLLADEGLLTPETEAEVAAAVKEHSDKAKREIEVLRASDEDEAAIASIAFDSSLEVQAQALEGRQGIGGGEAAISTMSARSPISDVIDESLKKATTTKAQAPAFDKLLTRIELNTTRLRELRDSLQGVVTDQELADVARRIDDIDRAIAAAITLSGEEATELAAREALVDVLTRTQKLIVFMTDLEVREQVGLESVVPVVPTDQEMQAERQKRIAQIEASIADLDRIIDAEAGGENSEKIADARAQLASRLQTLVETVDYTAFIDLSTDALNLAQDSLLLFERQEVPMPEPGADPTSTTTQSEGEGDDDESTATTTPAEGGEAAVDTVNVQTDGTDTAAQTQDAASTTEEIDTTDA